MVALSKPTLLDFTCYELGHTWTPSCAKASLDVARNVSTESLKIYGSLYLIAGLVQRKGKNYYRKKFWRDLAQSTLFLTTNGTLFITCFCIWRKLVGFYFYPCAIICGAPASGLSLSLERKQRKVVGSFYYTNTIAYIPCLVASYTAIYVERKSRRGQLAMYVGNLALETVWRMLKARGLVKSIPNGEVLMFSVASAIYLYYFKQKNGLPEGTMSIFKKMLGDSETPSDDTQEKRVADDSEEQSTQRRNGPIGQTTLQSSASQFYQPVVNWLKQCPSHQLCRHKHSCAFYILQGSLKMFGVGYGIQAVIKVFSSLTKVFKQPKTVISALVNKNNLELGAFLASFVGIFRALNCLLRWLRNKEDELHGLIAGFIAGWSMMFFKSTTIALYTALKLSELLYFKGIAAGKLPYIQCADIILYSISTALVFHAAVLEPHNLRPAYWRFLLRVTGNKFATMNRRLLDPWVPNCSTLYPDHWPDYDMRFTNLVKPASS